MNSSKLILTTSVIGSVVAASVFLKDYLVGGQVPLDRNISADGKVVIITGANTGIGRETARGLARRGATVYMACRDLVKCEEARKEIVLESGNRHVRCKKCDLADFNSIKEFAEEFKNSEQKLHILINNGGIMRCPKMVTKQGIEMQLGVNHMGHFFLTNLLLEHLKRSSPSRIVVVSSVAHTRGNINFEDLNADESYDPTQAYNQSKLANVLFTKELDRRLQGSGVTVNALHPGLVKTEIARHMGLENSILGSIFVKPILSFFLRSPEQGAQTTLYVALHPSLEKVSGKYFSDCNEKNVAPAGEDVRVAKRLWATTEKWTSVPVNPVKSNSQQKMSYEEK